MKRLVFLAAILALAVAPHLNSVSADTRPLAEDRGASGLAFAVRRLQTIASVLHTGAHPDDESTELLAYLARGEGARVAYLSLTRGEGGQNAIGPELGESLGIVRTEELLAARKLDGAEQYFTRAFDFGFTRSVDETLKKWNREEILEDMVRVIRTMRPLVVVNGFSGTSRDGHGQHQAAGTLTPEAIKAAADPLRFPDQIKEGLQPWTVLKLYGRIFGQVQGASASFDVGKFDPILGRSYAELAAEGRSKHRSQDFGMIQARGSQTRSFPRIQSTIQVPDRETSLFSGFDTSITAIGNFAGRAATELAPALGRIKDAAARAAAELRVEEPLKIVPHLASGLREVRATRSSLGALDAIARANVDSLLALKERHFNNALAKANGLVVDALSSTEIATPGGSLDLNVNVYLGNKDAGTAESLRKIEVKVAAPQNWVIEPSPSDQEASPAGPGGFGRFRERADATRRFRIRVPENEPPSQPYWLVRERTRDQFDWSSSMPRTLPFAPPRLTAQVTLSVGDVNVTINQPVEYRFSDMTLGEIRRDFKIAPAIAVTVRPGLVVIPSGSFNRVREVSVEIVHHANSATNAVAKLAVPAGWRVEGDSRPLAFTQPMERASRSFRVTPPSDAIGRFDLKAVVEADGKQYSNGHVSVSYPHIETHLVYHTATTKAEVFDVKVAPGLRVGYIMGSGDDVPQALSQLGVNLKVISEGELASGDLSAYDTIVLGIRVYEVRLDVVANNKRLLDYVASGGTLIVQYNKQEFSRYNVAPFPLKLEENQRITDETAAIEVLQPDHSLFNFPNRISATDWEGWVQERGLYFINEWDERYVTLLAGRDESGRRLLGGQLLARVGRGNYLFTGYAWFRQLPAGVPGAYRLFANMISLSKKS